MLDQELWRIFYVIEKNAFEPIVWFLWCDVLSHIHEHVQFEEAGIIVSHTWRDI